MADRTHQMKAALWPLRVHRLIGDLGDLREFLLGEPENALGIVGARDLLGHPGLIVADIGPAETILEHAILKEFSSEIDGPGGLVGIDDHGLAVGFDLVPAIGPQQRIQPPVVVAEAVPQFEAERMAFVFSFLPTSCNSSQVSGNLATPTSLNQSVRQFINWPMLQNGTAFHLPSTTTASRPASYQPPFFSPISLHRSVTSTYFSPNWMTFSNKFIVISAPVPVSVIVAIRVGRLPTAVTS